MFLLSLFLFSVSVSPFSCYYCSQSSLPVVVVVDRLFPSPSPHLSPLPISPLSLPVFSSSSRLLFPFPFPFLLSSLSPLSSFSFPFLSLFSVIPSLSSPFSQSPLPRHHAFLVFHSLPPPALWSGMVGRLPVRLDMVESLRFLLVCPGHAGYSFDHPACPGGQLLGFRSFSPGYFGNLQG